VGDEVIPFSEKNVAVLRIGLQAVPNNINRQQNAIIFDKPDLDHINPHQSLFSLCH